jgi:hypothetical protein
MADYNEHLRRLAMHDDALLGTIVVQGSSSPPLVVDERTEALLCIAAAIAVTSRGGTGG